MNTLFRQQAFSLIELLVFLAMASILMTMGLTYYSQHLAKTHRMEAIFILDQLALAMENKFLQEQSYRNASLANLGFKEKIVDGHYQLMIASTTDSTFMLQAKPLGSQAKKDISCGTLSHHSNGEKNISGTGRVADCWP